MNQIQRHPGTAFVPSSWRLSQQIDSAARRFEADREQAVLRQEASANKRMERAWEHETVVSGRRKRWGY